MILFWHHDLRLDLASSIVATATVDRRPVNPGAGRPRNMLSAPNIRPPGCLPGEMMSADPRMPSAVLPKFPAAATTTVRIDRALHRRAQRIVADVGLERACSDRLMTRYAY